MKKIIKFLINVVIAAFILYITEFIIYKYNSNVFLSDTNVPDIYKTELPYFPRYTHYFPKYMTDLEDYFNGENNIFFGRKPDGLEYKDKTPIVVFGCSYAFGQYLNYNQTFSYKLAHKLKRPVYNRAISGGSFQHMYLQSTSESLYNTIPAPDTVIYIMIQDHYRRSMVNYFQNTDMHIMPHYSIKNNKLTADNYNNKLLMFIKSLYITRHLNHIYADRYISNKKNSEKITDNAVLYLSKSRRNFEEKWHAKPRFIVILYEDWDIMYKEELRKKLEDNGFVVLETKDITNEDLRIEKYQMQDNHHPSEQAWDMLVPKIAELLK